MSEHGLLPNPSVWASAPSDEKSKNYENMKGNVMGELKKTFKPEFLNRMDEIIVFHPLDEEHLKQIVGFMIEGLAKRLKQNAIILEVSDEAKMFLAKKGFDQAYGARPLRRAIQSMVEDKLAEEMLEGKVRTGDKVMIDMKDNDLTVSKA